MSSDEVVVRVGSHDLPAGLLGSTQRRGRDVGAHFTYYPSYLADPRSYPIDPQLPLTSGAQVTRGGQLMFGAFTDCAPDRWGRTLMQRAARRRADAHGVTARALTELDFLLGARDDLRQGALRFRRAAGGPFLAEDQFGVPPLAMLGELLELADRAEDGRLVAEELAKLVRGGSSLGGARPKAHVVSSDGTAAIAKFPSRSSDTWDVMAWEATTLHLARDAGIAVPDFQLLDIGGRSVLVVERFDRRGALDGPAERVGYVSAMTMLEESDGAVGDFLELAEVAELHSPAATLDIHQLWRRAVFSALVSNTDNHLRNHGYLRAGSGWRLAPAFDVNPNPDRGELTVGMAGAFTQVVQAAVDHAETFRLERVEALAVLEDVVGAVSRWRQVGGRHGLTPAAVEQMRPAFESTEAATATALLSGG